MKLELDTKNKTIKIAQSVNLKEMIDLFEEILPDGKWKEFTLETNVSIKWDYNPIIIEKSPFSRPYWYEQPWIINSNTEKLNPNTDIQYTLNEGTFNIQY